MKNKKKIKILLLVLACMILSACGREKEEMMPDEEEPGYAVDGEAFLDNQKEEAKEQEMVDEADVDEQAESIENALISERSIEIIPTQKADILKMADEGGRALTAEELQLFDEMIKKNGNYGFLLSAYDTPADANLNEIFYNGLGENQDMITEEEEQAYLKAIGESELFTDFNKITTAQLNDFLLEKTGLSYEQMNTRLGWTYLPEFDAYYSQHGDTNYRIFNCKEGYTTDEKLFVLRVEPENYGYADGYHEMRYELILEKNGETYQFRSNRLILEEGLIEDQSFQVSLAPVGDVIFASYLPNTEEIPLADVSFSIIKDGWEITRLYGVYSENIREAEVFNKIEAVTFADYDEDGIADVIMILNYSPVSDKNTAYSEIRVYKGEYEDYSYGDYYYFQRYQMEISETLTAELSEKTISAVLDYLARELPGENID